MPGQASSPGNLASFTDTLAQASQQEPTMPLAAAAASGQQKASIARSSTTQASHSSTSDSPAKAASSSEKKTSGTVPAETGKQAVPQQLQPGSELLVAQLVQPVEPPASGLTSGKEGGAGKQQASHQRSASGNTAATQPAAGVAQAMGSSVPSAATATQASAPLTKATDSLPSASGSPSAVPVQGAATFGSTEVRDVSPVLAAAVPEVVHGSAGSGSKAGMPPQAVAAAPVSKATQAQAAPQTLPQATPQINSQISPQIKFAPSLTAPSAPPNLAAAATVHVNGKLADQQGAKSAGTAISPVTTQAGNQAPIPAKDQAASSLPAQQASADLQPVQQQAALVAAAPAPLPATAEAKVAVAVQPQTDVAAASASGMPAGKSASQPAPELRPELRTAAAAASIALSQTTHTQPASSLGQTQSRLFPQAAAPAAKSTGVADGESERGSSTSHDAHKNSTDDSSSAPVAGDSRAPASGSSASTSPAPAVSALAAEASNAGVLAAAAVPAQPVQVSSAEQQVPASVSASGSKQDGLPTGAETLPSVAAGADAHALPSISTARVLQTMQGSEMRVGMHSADLGNVSVSTSVGRESIAAQISFEHMDLGKALTAHLPSIEAKLSNEYGMSAKVEVRDQSMASAGQGAQGEGRREGGATGTPSSNSTTTAFSSSSGYTGSVDGLASSSSLTGSAPLDGSSRLDIRV